VHESPFSRRVRLAGIVAIWGPLMACQPTAPAAPSTGTPTTTAQATAAQKNDKSAQEHLYRLNSSPQHALDIEFEIHDAPGLFADFGSNVHYQSFNCNYVTSEWAGTRGSPSKMVSLPTTQLDKTRFVVTAFRDGLLDEDYYGTGVCQWTLTAVSIGFRATGAKDDTGYAVLLGAKDLNPGTSFRLYYWKGGYPGAKNESGVPVSNSGRRDPEGYSEPFRSNLFSITTKVKAKP
jgi:hypothetical protein